MSKLLTPIAIDKLKPKATRYEIPDGGQRGLLIVVFPSGKKSFIVRYRFAGIKRKLTLGDIGLAAARKAAAEALYEVHQGRDPCLAKQDTKARAAITNTETVQWLCEQYIEREGDKLRSIDVRKRAFAQLVYPEIGDVPLSALKRSQIVKLLDRVQDQNGDRRADLVLAYLRKVFNWHASRVDDFLSPVVKGMGRYDDKARERSRVLNDDELQKIWAATESPHPYHTMVRFLLLTGARRDEARRLPWSEIVGTDWHLPAARNKVNTDFTRPLSKAAQTVLQGLSRIDGGDLVFSLDGHRPMELAKPKARLDVACGVTDWILHDCRRTARTLLSRAGIAADIGERSLGHTISGVRGVYDRHKFHAEMAHAFEALASLISRIVNPPPANVVKITR
jgi:integrase